MKTIRRRRLEGKTDYKGRLALIKSDLPRLVVRKTNRYIIAQIVVSELARDKVLLGVDSKILLSKGLDKKYSGSLKSLPAAYLTGFILGKLALKKEINKVILDIGLHRNIHKSRIYSLVKGVLDAGLNVPCKKEVLPDEDRIKNDKYSKLINKITKLKEEK